MQIKQSIINNDLAHFQHVYVVDSHSTTKIVNIFNSRCVDKRRLETETQKGCVVLIYPYYILCSVVSKGFPISCATQTRVYLYLFRKT